MSTLQTPSSCEELLARMVAVNSVNPEFGGPVGGEAALATYLEMLAQSWGLNTARVRVSEHSFDLIITCEFSPQLEWLLFESHLDTVGTTGMNIPPLALTVSEGRLYGRGTCDTKGSGAAMLWALRDYSQCTAHARNAGVVFSVDEEAMMTGAQAFARELPKFERLRGIIVGEPTELQPVVAHNGAVRWRTVTRGVSAHSSDPSKGRSAISAMVRVIDALETRFVPTACKTYPLTGRAAASINVIRGGSAVNVIPDFCEIECDRRLIPGEDVAQVFADRDAALAGLEVEHDNVYIAHPLSDRLSAPLHEWMTPAFHALGLNAAATGKPYATNASHYAAAGAPVLVLGPGSIAQAHTRDEWLAKAQLETAVELYRQILLLPA